MTRVVLASGSPRRRELLDQLGVSFDVIVPDIDETPFDGEDARAYVRRLASAKAVAVPADGVVIAADTTVDLGGRILGKPVDADDAAAMLRALSGRTHRVHTGVAVRLGATEEVDVATTFVTMTPIGESALRWYLATGEPLDKAGRLRHPGCRRRVRRAHQGQRQQRGRPPPGDASSAWPHPWAFRLTR